MSEVNMLERVARVLCTRAGKNPDRVHFPASDAAADTDLAEPAGQWAEWHPYVDLAHEILFAMREPTKGMVTAAGNAAAYDAWHAMIEMALAEQ
jgi:hypothetical protein